MKSKRNLREATELFVTQTYPSRIVSPICLPSGLTGIGEGLFSRPPFSYLFLCHNTSTTSTFPLMKPGKN